MAHTMSPEEYQELGRRYYKQQQYDKAVEAFTRGIEATGEPTVTQFDQRAASYEKLNDFNAALKDGREMIKRHSEHVKGYLRTASILQKVNKPEKAIDIYKYGMKHVPVDNKDFKYLQQLHDKLTRQLSPDRAVDPFRILPLELAQMVAEHLTFKARVNCLRVCKGWKSFLTSCPQLWTDLDLSGARKDVSRIFVRNAVNYSQYKVQSAIIHRFRQPDMILSLATACKDLASLEFLSGSFFSKTVVEASQCAMNLKKLVVRTDITFDAISQIFRFRPTLEHAEFCSIAHASTAPDWKGPFPNLRTLVLDANTWGLRVNLWCGLVQKAPALRSLSLRHFGDFDIIEDLQLSSLPLTHLALVDVSLDSLPQLPMTLEQLTVSSIPFSTIYPWQPLPNLTHLSLEHLDQRQCARILESLLVTKSDAFDEPREHQPTKEFPVVKNLRHLSLGHCSITFDLPRDIDETIVYQKIYNSPRMLTKDLQYLDVALTPFNDDTCEQISAKKTSIATLNLTSTNVTGAGVKHLIDHTPTLRTLILDGCERITSRDIVEYAEKRGISVSMKMTAPTGKGRKVRY